MVSCPSSENYCFGLLVDNLSKACSAIAAYIAVSRVIVVIFLSLAFEFPGTELR